MNSTKIGNRTYEMHLSVKGVKEIALICPNGEFGNLEKAIETNNDNDRYEFISKVAVILNKCAIMKRAFDNDEPCPAFDKIDDCLTVDAIDNLDPFEFVELIFKPVLVSLKGDSETTIEVEEDSKNAKKPKAKSR